MARKLTYSLTHFTITILATAVCLSTNSKAGDIDQPDTTKSPKIQAKQLQRKEAVSVVTLKYSRKPAVTKTLSYADRQYIAATIDSACPWKLVVLSSFANDWLEVFKSGYENSCHSFDSVKFAIIDNMPYVSYLCHTSGSGAEFGSFVLFSILSKDTFQIEYQIYFATGETKLGEIPAKVSANPNILSFLESKIKESGYFEKQDGELDVNSSINARKKWLADNPRIYNQIKSNSTVEYSFSTYKENLCKETSINKGDVIDSSENRAYKVWVFFRGSCIGYKKATHEYFIIWVPQDPYDCFNSLEIDDTKDPRCLKIDAKNKVIFNLGINRQEYLVDLTSSTVSLLGRN